MTVLKRHTEKLRCPAVELAHPIFSLNDMDCECRIAGRLQPLATSPCVGDYTRCAIWRTHKDNEWANTSVKVAEAQRRRAKRRVLDTNRDTIIG